MIKALARQTNNEKQFCGQRKGGKFKVQYVHFTKFCTGLHEILSSTGSTAHLLLFASMSEIFTYYCIKTRNLC